MILDFKTDMVDDNLRLTPWRFTEKGDWLQSPGFFRSKKCLDIFECEASVYDVFDDNYRPVFDVGIDIFQELYGARRGGGVIARNSNKIQSDGASHSSNQVG